MLALAVAAALALPPVGVRADYQLGGPYPPAPGVGIVVRDRTARPAGVYDVCYVNAFQVDSGRTSTRSLHSWSGDVRPGAKRSPARWPRRALLRRDGKLVIDRAWDEPLLDTRRPALLLRVVGPWIDRCARDGYEAVEFDNLDSWTRSRGALKRRDAVAYARRLTDRAHAAGLAAAQKNASELAPRGRAIGFDFAVAEECQVYRECDAYARAYDDRVIEVEYADEPFAAACADHGARLSVVRRDRDLLPPARRAHVARWCP